MEKFDWLFMFNLLGILKLQQRFRSGGWALGGLQGHFTLNNLLPEILQRNSFQLDGAITQHPLVLLKRRKDLTAGVAEEHRGLLVPVAVRTCGIVVTRRLHQEAQQGVGGWGGVAVSEGGHLPARRPRGY